MKLMNQGKVYLNRLADCSLLLVLFSQFLWGTNFNTPFPRIGVVTFGDQFIGEEIWKGHDLVINRPSTDLSTRLKQKKSDVINLAATDDLVENDGLGGDLPADWHVKKVNGERVFAGEGWWMNISDYCPRRDFVYKGENYAAMIAREFFAEYFKRTLDWNLYDGVFFDSWASSIRYIGSQYDSIDFDQNGIADNQEGNDLADQRWQTGNQKLADEFHNRLPAGKMVAAHEAGPSEAIFLNGLGDEGWTGGSWQWTYDNLWIPYQINGPQPHVNFVEVQGNKNSFQRMRYGRDGLPHRRLCRRR